MRNKSEQGWKKNAKFVPKKKANHMSIEAGGRPQTTFFKTCYY